MSERFGKPFIRFEDVQDQMVQDKLVKQTKNSNLQRNLETNVDYRLFLPGQIRRLRGTV
jgi:hypothetical protein